MSWEKHNRGSVLSRMIKKIARKIYGTILYRISPVKYARKIGVSVGENCWFNGKVSFGSEPYLVSIGNHVCLAGKGTIFITHEGAHWVLMGMDEKYNDTFGYGRITIKDNVFIGSGTTILRGVTIGENVIVGACSLVNKSLPANGVYAGVPAKYICSIDEWKEKFLAQMPEYDKENYRKNKKQEVLKIVDKGRTR